MSRGINKVTLIGNLGADPDVRFTQSGEAIANVSLATSDSWKDKQTGEAKETTEWHRVVFFGKLAEIVQALPAQGLQGVRRGPVAHPQVAGRRTGRTAPPPRSWSAREARCRCWTPSPATSPGR